MANDKRFYEPFREGDPSNLEPMSLDIVSFTSYPPDVRREHIEDMNDPVQSFTGYIVITEGDNEDLISAVKRSWEDK